MNVALEAVRKLAKNTEANLSVVLGAYESGIFVQDIEELKEGLEDLTILERAHTHPDGQRGLLFDKQRSRVVTIRR